MTGDKERLRIYSLGHFSLYFGEEPVTEADGGMSKTWNLFKYLLTHREQSIPGEVITEVFWPGAAWQKSRHSLYNSVYRLRSVLESDRSPYDSSSLFLIRDGMYSFNRHADYWLDAAEFEDLCSRAREVSDDDEQAAIKLYRKALRLYRGDYLAENFYDDWVKGAQNRYRSLYKKAVLECSDLLLDAEIFDEVRDICERALEVEPLDEDIQIRLIESLIEAGNLRDAKTHYERFSSLIYQESGILPSKRMRSLYQKIQVNAGGTAATDLETIQELLDQRDDDGGGGAYFCDQDSFHRMYNLERKRMARTGLSAFLVKIDLSRKDLTLPSMKELNRAAAELQEVLLRTLRRGDVVSRWNDTQYLLVLPMVNGSDIRKVVKRIGDQFKKQYTGPVVLRIRETAISPENTEFHRVQEKI